jgi:alpha-glucuronidase
MTLEGYKAAAIVPWEAASGGKAITCAAAKCTASWHYDGTAGWRTLRVQYFDQPIGQARFRVFVAGQMVDQWTAAEWTPARKMDSSSSMRRTISGVALRPGDELRIEGIPDGSDPAGLDYLEILN